MSPAKNTSLSRSACGIINTTMFTNLNSQTPGSNSSKTALSTNGVEPTNTPAEMNSTQWSTPLYYDGETQTFSPPSPFVASTPTNLVSEFTPPPLPAQPQKNNNNNKNKKKTNNKIKRKKDENKENGKNNNKEDSQAKKHCHENIDDTNNNILKATDNSAGDDAYPPSPASSMSPRVNECSANKIKLRIYTHNVNGLRDESKLEFIPRIMKKKSIDAYLIQETHLAGDFEKILIDNYCLIHHGPESQPINGKRGGVAIILSPSLHLQWKTSRKAKKILRGGLSTGETTRFLSISMRFEMPGNNNNNNNNAINRRKKNHTNADIKRKYHNLCLTTIYFPHSGYKEKELDDFNANISDFLSNILAQKNTTHIIGTDANSSIGTRKSTPESESLPDKYDNRLDIDPALELLGPFGNPHRSKSGERLLNIMREHQLRAAATFFDNNNKYNTWLAPPTPTNSEKTSLPTGSFPNPEEPAMPNNQCQTQI